MLVFVSRFFAAGFMFFFLLKYHKTLPRDRSHERFLFTSDIFVESTSVF